jgi:hypothetical protein
MEAKVARKLYNYIKKVSPTFESLPFDDDSSNTDTDTIPLDRGGEGLVIKPLDEESIRKKLSTEVLSIEIQNRFPELFKVRESVILKSHCYNHLVSYDSNAPFEEIPANDEDSLVIASSVNLEDIDYLKSIIFGMRNKRLYVMKGGKRVKDDPNRDKFLLLLTQCWTISGADLIEEKLLSSKMNTIIIKESINFMEQLIAKILSEFIFLNYKECSFGKVLYFV